MGFGPLALLALLASVRAIVKLPPAPYNVKLYCRSGRRDSPSSVNPTLCPTSSASCGYFEFPQPASGTNTTGIYECVDSSIVMNEDFDYGVYKMDPFANLCADLPLCHELDVDFLNKQFFTYLVRTYGLEVESFTKKKFRFCCTLSHSNLGRLIKSGKDVLPFSDNVAPVTCSQIKCDHGSVGCFYHYVTPSSEPTDNRDYYTSPEDMDDDEGENDHPASEYVDIKPVELTWGEEDFVIDENAARLRLPRSGRGLSRSPPESDEIEPIDFTPNYKGHQCVKMHLNNEVYRYCMMIYAQKSGDRCIQLGDHKICCCFVNPYETTCDPQQSAPAYPRHDLKPTTPPIASTPLAILPTNPVPIDWLTEAPLIPSTETALTSSTVTPSEQTTMTFPVTNNQRTRCRTVLITETRPPGKYKTKPRQRKRIICDDIRSSTPAPLSRASRNIGICIHLVVFYFWAL
uniref:CLIP domain-containing serine protease n=1 Tax=Panagrellus redivivus TaxID=6233 RepID=A0A7E4VJJ8_PANRE